MNEKIKYYREIMEEMHLANAHAHIPSEQVWHTGRFGFENIVTYCLSDLISAGLPKKDAQLINKTDSPEVMVSNKPSQTDPILSAVEKWKLIEPYWKYVRCIGSGRQARATLRRYFEVDDFDVETVEKIEKKLPELQKRSYFSLYSEVKVDKVIGVSMGGSAVNPSTELVPQQLYSDLYTQPTNRDTLLLLESLTDIEIYSLDTYINALDAFLDKEIKQGGMVGFKWHKMPFVRENTFELASPYEAAKALDQILANPPEGSLFSATSRSYDEMRPLHNYLHHHLIHKAIEYNVPIQIHTGTFGSTNGNYLQNSNPTLLSGLFVRYPQARFDLLHSAWPYARELGEMARQFPNVYLNTTWMQTLSPVSFKNFMTEWAMWVPTNKIFGFGCDEFNVLNSCGCADVYRDLMAEILYGLTEEHGMREKDAIQFAELVSKENVYRYWNLPLVP